MQYVWQYHSPIGKIMLSSDGEGLTGLWFENQRYVVDKLREEKCIEKNLPVLESTAEWLNIYFKGEKPRFTPQLHLKGTLFQREVWDILKQIPYGKTMTYKEIACQVARQRGIVQMSAQAIGGAVGHNPISIIVPCHRVIGTNGKLIGYAGGMDKKAYLLSLENRASTNFMNIWKSGKE